MKATKKMAYAAMATMISCTATEAHRAEIAAREAMDEAGEYTYEVGIEYDWDPFDGMYA